MQVVSPGIIGYLSTDSLLQVNVPSEFLQLALNIF